MPCRACSFMIRPTKLAEKATSENSNSLIPLILNVETLFLDKDFQSHIPRLTQLLSRGAKLNF